jgi:hypothetical protein
MKEKPSNIVRIETGIRILVKGMRTQELGKRQGRKKDNPSQTPSTSSKINRTLKFKTER